MGALKKKNSQKDGSKNRKPKLNRRFMKRKGKNFSQNMEQKRQMENMRETNKESPRSPTSE